MGYKSTLRSSLITINYEDKFETLNDLVQSGIPLAIGKRTIVGKIASNDPRPTVQSLHKTAIGFPFVGGSLPRYINDM